MNEVRSDGWCANTIQLERTQLTDVFTTYPKDWIPFVFSLLVNVSPDEILAAIYLCLLIFLFLLIPHPSPSPSSDVGGADGIELNPSTT